MRELWPLYLDQCMGPPLWHSYYSYSTWTIQTFCTQEPSHRLLWTCVDGQAIFKSCADITDMPSPSIILLSAPKTATLIWLQYKQCGMSNDDMHAVGLKPLNSVSKSQGCANGSAYNQLRYICYLHQCGACVHLLMEMFLVQQLFQFRKVYQRRIGQDWQGHIYTNHIWSKIHKAILSMKAMHPQGRLREHGYFDYCIQRSD